MNHYGGSLDIILWYVTHRMSMEVVVETSFETSDSVCWGVGEREVHENWMMGGTELN